MRQPDRDLCADLRNHRDEELGDDENVCSASNRHLRLYVAGYMLSDGTSDGDARGLREALQLYTSIRPTLLDRLGRLTTQEIAAEVTQLVAMQAELRSRPPECKGAE